ncbi:MAG: VIT family protein, partial [Bacteroidia bacterium]|nr:VIT family protein [Bacteroidia bacterium]MBP7245953.1 VIT family protein [Bacteroidia bacterium]
PLLTVLFAPIKGMEYWLYGSTILFLILLGAMAAKTGGSTVGKAILRITVWGTLAMGLSAFVGYLFGVNL